MTFSIGDKVIWMCGQPGSCLYRIDEIFKVHKNGNCRLKNGPQQYSQSGHKTGDGYFGSTIKPWTQEREDQLKAKRTTYTWCVKFRNLMDAMSSAASKKNSKITDEILRDLSAVLQKMTN